MPRQQPIGADTVLELRELSVTPEGDEYLVGDLARGEFIAVPPIALAVMNALRAGRTTAEAAAAVSASDGVEVDVADFAAQLVQLGFAAVAGSADSAPSGPRLSMGGRAGAAAARLARPLYTWPAFACYGLLLAGCLAGLAAVRGLRPSYHQLFFLPNPVASFVLLSLLWMPLGAAHELAHWLGARVQGLPARICVSRRYYELVLQTDLSALWSVPRGRRFAPLLAGLASDTIALAVFVAARAAELAGWLRLPVGLSRLTAALIVAQLLGIAWQLVVFMRTDLYAVLVTGLGCQNLTRISRLHAASRYRKLSGTESVELATASKADLSAARWYWLVQAGGLVIVSVGFFRYLLPFAIYIIRWTAAGLARNPPTSVAFWQVAASGRVIIVPLALPLAAAVAQRCRAGKLA
jgi:putative peptide zinc metalloprotease protein